MSWQVFTSKEHQTKVDSDYVVEAFGGYFFNGCILARNSGPNFIVQDVNFHLFW
jgi:hypothetical protein